MTPPGPRLLRHVPFRFLQARLRRGRRKTDFDLPLVSFVDCLLCIVLFLLASFSARGDCPERERVPSAENALPAVEAPIVSVTRRQIVVDGTAVGDTESIKTAGRLTRVGELFNHLKAKRELWRQLNPGGDFPGVVVLQVDRSVPAVVVKSAFQTRRLRRLPQRQLPREATRT